MLQIADGSGADRVTLDAIHSRKTGSMRESGRPSGLPLH